MSAPHVPAIVQRGNTQLETTSKVSRVLRDQFSSGSKECDAFTMRNNAVRGPLWGRESRRVSCVQQKSGRARSGKCDAFPEGILE
jgi:hypothetical protein